MAALTLECAAAAASTPAHAAGYRIETVAEGLAYPWSLAFLPDGRMLVTERAGRLRVIQPGAAGRTVLAPQAVQGLPPVLRSGQAGVFEVLPDAGFARNGWIYLSFAQGTLQANQLAVVRARFDGGRLHDVTPIFTARPAKPHDQHFGGRMVQLPDTTLAITLGDGNVERTDAQRLDTPWGKTVRIARDGSVPADNPFIGRAGALPEIHTLGHRNPQGITLVPAPGGTATLYAHEHGSKGGDELNRIERGANYGWPLTTGGVDYTGARITPYRTLPGVVPPLLEWTPSIAPAGMAYYDGTLFPRWRGSLFVAALKEKSVRRVALEGGAPAAQETLFQELGERLRDVRAGPDGALYLLTDSEQGKVLRVVPQ